MSAGAVLAAAAGPRSMDVVVQVGGGSISDVGLLAIFVLAVFVGFEVVSKVSTTLHTPLMSGANAIHGIILVGSVIVAGRAHNPFAVAVALVAVVLATVNLVGGFVVTDRMLEMFKPRPKPQIGGSSDPGRENGAQGRGDR